MTSIFNVTKEELESYFIDKGEKKFKATQVFEWIYRKEVYIQIQNENKEATDVSGIEELKKLL